MSKTGPSVSVGVPGARFNARLDGATRTTLSLPGTGLSMIDRHAAPKRATGAAAGPARATHAAQTAPAPSGTPPSPPTGTPSYLAQQGILLCLAGLGVLAILRWLVIIGGAAAVGLLVYFAAFPPLNDFHIHP